jgi:hypothetical protein
MLTEANATAIPGQSSMDQQVNDGAQQQNIQTTNETVTQNQSNVDHTMEANALPNSTIQ